MNKSTKNYLEYLGVSILIAMFLFVIIMVSAHELSVFNDYNSDSLLGVIVWVISSVVIISVFLDPFAPERKKE